MACLLLGCAHAPRTPIRGALPPGPAQSARTQFVSPHSYAWFTRAELHAAHGRDQQAADAYRMVLIGGDDPYVMTRLAATMERLGQPDDAREVLHQALAIDRCSEAAWLALGAMARRGGRFSTAVAAYERAENCAKGSSAAPLALAALLTKKAPDRALAVLRRFSARSEAGSANMARAMLELALLRGDAARAAQAAEQLLRVAPASAALLQRTGDHLLRQGKPSMAWRVLEAASTADVQLLLSAQLAAGRWQEAEQLLVTAEPASLGDTSTIAEAFLRVGKPERAAELASAALVSSPDPRLELVLAEADLALGRYAEAARRLSLIPPKSAVYARSRRALIRALSGGGLAAVGAELATPGAQGPR